MVYMASPVRSLPGVCVWRLLSGPCLGMCVASPVRSLPGVCVWRLLSGRCMHGPGRQRWLAAGRRVPQLRPSGEERPLSGRAGISAAKMRVRLGPSLGPVRPGPASHGHQTGPDGVPCRASPIGGPGRARMAGRLGIPPKDSAERGLESERGLAQKSKSPGYGGSRPPPPPLPTSFCHLSPPGIQGSTARRAGPSLVT